MRGRLVSLIGPIGVCAGRACAASHRLAPALVSLIMLQTGCAIIPEVVHEPQLHNPFPQLQRVAVLPFFNQSDSPTLSQDRVALAYYNELQQIPGFEVMPVGVAKRKILDSKLELTTGTDYQKLAQALGVDAVIVGAVTDYSPYYPPRIGLAVSWYAANPCFHPIPPGYGLPWRTSDEEYIPAPVVFEAEFALAREQLKTQTPNPADELLLPTDTDEQQPPAWLKKGSGTVAGTAHRVLRTTAADPFLNHAQLPMVQRVPEPYSEASFDAGRGSPEGLSVRSVLIRPDGPNIPDDWPDPRGFVPPPPSPARPACIRHRGPIITHVQTYNGHDSDFTTALANYYFFRDEARFGGWQAYLQRSDDFVRFCCYLHIAETLAARGGAGETRVVWRWPIDR